MNGDGENDGTDKKKKYDMSEWEYRGEGNHNIVIANTKKHFVYRLAKKHSTATGIPLSKNGCTKEVSPIFVRKKLHRRVQFAQHVIAPLLGRHFVTSGELVDLDEEFIADICKNVVSEASRDEKYCSELSPDLVYPFAWKLPDFCFHDNECNNNNNNNSHSAPTFTIEIKPSVMFVSHHADDECAHKTQGNERTKNAQNGATTSRQASDKLASLRDRMCRHCFTNQTKVLKGIWKNVSHSCPVDLISGDVERMKFALHDLLKTPHHRLHVYKEGQTVFNGDLRDGLEDKLRPYFGYKRKSSSMSATDHLIDVVIRSLLYTPEKQAAVSTGNKMADNRCNGKKCNLHRNSDGAKCGKYEEMVRNDSPRHKTYQTTAEIPTNTSSSQKLSEMHEETSQILANGGSWDEPRSDCVCSLRHKSAVLCSDTSHSMRTTSRHTSQLGTSLTSARDEIALQICCASPFHRSGRATPGVPRGSVLDTIRRAQMVSGLNVLSVYPYFVRVAAHLKHHPDDRRRHCLDGPYDTEPWMRVISDPDLDHCPDTDSIEYAIKKLQQFLIYLTLKGSSIMVTIQPQPASCDVGDVCNDVIQRDMTCFIITDALGNNYKVSMSVLDLDPKSIEKIQRMYWRDLEDFLLIDT